VFPAAVEALGEIDAMLGRTDAREPLHVATLAHCAEAVHRVLHVPPDLAWFMGHFPSEPILPGIVQVGWAVNAARVLTGRAEGPASVQQLKFKSPIRPQSIVDLALARVDGGVTFAFRSARGECSSGRLLYQD
jgi:3-hydroxymyristoyl/3-hydroxydecanoyl-(acyl carrier protein) dehydratase